FPPSGRNPHLPVLAAIAGRVYSPNVHRTFAPTEYVRSYRIAPGGLKCGPPLRVPSPNVHRGIRSFGVRSVIHIQLLPAVPAVPAVSAVPVWFWVWVRARCARLGMGGVAHNEKLRQLYLRKTRSPEIS